MALFGNRVFADVIKVRIKIRSSWIRVGSESNESAFRRDSNEHTERHGKEDDVKMGAELGVTHLQAKNCQQPPRVERGRGTESSSEPFKKNQPCQHLDF